MFFEPSVKYRTIILKMFIYKELFNIKLKNVVWLRMPHNFEELFDSIQLKCQ